MKHLECSTCGAAMAIPATTQLHRCVFCGAHALETVERQGTAPTLHLPFALDADKAQAIVSRLLPGANPVAIWLPIWVVDIDALAHFAALEFDAKASSAKRPSSGTTHRTFRQTIPASRSITAGELDRLGDFDGRPEPWLGDGCHELPRLSAIAALDEARAQLREQTAASLERSRGLTQCGVSLEVTHQTASLRLVPVYVATRRLGSHVGRVLVHGITGQAIGAAPLDRRRLVASLLAALLLLAVLLIRAG